MARLPRDRRRVLRNVRREDPALRVPLITASRVQGRGAAADVERHQRVELRRFDHHIDIDLFVPRGDAPAARTDLDRRNSKLVVDVRIGPDAGAIGRFGFDLLAEEVLVNLLGRFHQRLDILAFVAEQRLVELELVVDAERLQRLFHLVLDRNGPHLRRHADVDIDRADAGKVIRPVGRAAFDGADIDLRKQRPGRRLIDVLLLELRAPALDRGDDLGHLHDRIDAFHRIGGALRSPGGLRLAEGGDLRLHDAGLRPDDVQVRAVGSRPRNRCASRG